jgi:hypothetical protein
MKSLLQCASAVLLLYAGMAHADSYTDAIGTFKSAGKSGAFFDKSYGYAVFPTIGGAGFLVGAAHASSGASADSSNANTKGSYHNGMAVFTIAKGGLMYAATISGQKFDFTPRGGS